VIVERSQADGIARQWCAKLRDLLPRQQYEMRIQAMVGTKAIASERCVPPSPPPHYPLAAERVPHLAWLPPAGRRPARARRGEARLAKPSGSEHRLTRPLFPRSDSRLAQRVSPVRKDVLVKVTGLDRKRKQLDKQKAGKARMKRFAGNIELSQEIFYDVLSTKSSGAKKGR